MLRQVVEYDQAEQSDAIACQRDVQVCGIGLTRWKQSRLLRDTQQRIVETKMIRTEGRNIDR